MKLEDQVVSLELAKRLKELGVKQNSYFWWHFGDKESWLNTYGPQPNQFAPSVAAFTVAELGEMLPLNCRTRRSIDEPGFWLIDSLGVDHFFRDRFEANARAKMLIHLIESGVVKP